MAGADIAGVLGVVGKIFVTQQPVLVANQPVRAHARGIEFNLNLYVLRDGEQRTSQLVDQHLPRLQRAIDVGVVAVPVLGELLHLGVLQIPLSEAQDREEDAALTLLLDEAHHLGVAGDTDVEIAVGGEDDAVIAARDEVRDRFGVGAPDPGAARGGASGLQAFDRFENLSFFRARRRRQDKTGRAGVDDDRDPIVGP